MSCACNVDLHASIMEVTHVGMAWTVGGGQVAVGIP